MIPALPHCHCHQILKTSVIFKKLTYNSTIKSKRLRDTQNIFLFSFLASLYLLVLLLFLFVDANCRDYLGYIYIYIYVCVCVKKAPLLRRISWKTQANSNWPKLRAFNVFFACSFFKTTRCCPIFRRNQTEPKGINLALSKSWRGKKEKNYTFWSPGCT